MTGHSSTHRHMLILVPASPRLCRVSEPGYYYWSRAYLGRTDLIMDNPAFLPIPGHILIVEARHEAHVGARPKQFSFLLLIAVLARMVLRATTNSIQVVTCQWNTYFSIKEATEP